MESIETFENISTHKRISLTVCLNIVLSKLFWTLSHTSRSNDTDGYALFKKHIFKLSALLNTSKHVLYIQIKKFESGRALHLKVWWISYLFEMRVNWLNARMSQKTGTKTNIYRIQYEEKGWKVLLIKIQKIWMFTTKKNRSNSSHQHASRQSLKCSVKSRWNKKSNIHPCWNIFNS